MQESSAELWLTMRVMPTVDKTPQGQSRPREPFATYKSLQSLRVQPLCPGEVVGWEVVWVGRAVICHDLEHTTLSHGARG